MKKSLLRIGLLGIGSMGIVVAKALLEKGYSVSGHRRGDQADFVALGGEPATTIDALIRESDVILLLLPSGFDLRKLDENSAKTTSTFRTGQCVVSLGTYPLEAKAWMHERVRARGGEFYDCEISGTPPMVEAREGAVFVSSDSEIPDFLTRIFRSFSDKVTHVGSLGNASVVKLLANHLVAINNMAVAEVMLVGERAGLQPSAVLAALQTSAGASKMLSVRGPLMVSRSFRPAIGETGAFLRVLRLVVDLARKTGSATPLLDKAQLWYDEASTGEQGNCDIAAVLETLERRSK